MESLLINASNMTAGVRTLVDNYSNWHAQKSILVPDIGPPILKFSLDGHQIFPRYQVEKINNCDDDIILIDNIGEGSNSLQWIEKYKKGPRYVIFTNGTWRNTRAPLPDSAILIVYHLFLYDYATMYFTTTRPFGINGDKRYRFDGEKSYSFISLIGTPRNDRKSLVDKILQGIEHDDFVLKLGGHNLKQQPPKEYDPTVFANSDAFINFYQVIGGMSTFRWNTISHTLPIDLYNQAYFFLVVETVITDTVDNETFHLTEKTIKCLLTGMPFVMMSTHKFLHNLRELGFRTYDDLWDESYDLEPNLEIRSKKVIDLCNDLYRFDWTANQQKLRAISLHNLEVLANSGKKMNDFFVDLTSIVKSIDL